MMFILKRFGIAFLPLLLLGSVWPQFMHDSQNTGRTNIVVQDSLEVYWTYSPPQGGPAWNWSQPVLDNNGNIYYGTGSYFISVDTSGNLRWYRQTQHAYAGPAAVLGDTVYFACSEGSLFAYTTDGTELWSFPMIHPMNGGPTLGPDGTIYIPDDITVEDTAYVYAVNPDGSVKWAAPFDSSNGIYTTPALDPDGSKLYITAGDWYLHALNTSDGSVIWSYPLQSAFNINYSSPSVFEYNGSKYVLCGDLGDWGGTGRWYAVNENGGGKWIVETNNSIQNTAAFGLDGSSYLGCNDGTLRKVDVNGNVVWTHNFGNVYVSNPLINGNGDIFVGTDNGFYILDSSDGSIIWQTSLGGTVSCPILGPEGQVYVIVGSGNLVCLKNFSGVKEDRNKKPKRIFLEVTPNPSRGKFHISLRNDNNWYLFKIYSINGREIFARRFRGDFVWSPKEKASGIYFLKCWLRNGDILTKKLIFVPK